MSCLFCSSFFHVSHNCNLYTSDETRKSFAVLNNRCIKCLAIKNPGGTECRSCRSQQKCYICFSKHHHTVYCQDRLTVLTMILPKIDQILFSRFVNCLSVEEKYYVALSFPNIFNGTNFKPLNIYHQQCLSLPNDANYSDIDFVVAEKVKFKYRSYGAPTSTFKETGVKFFARHLTILLDYTSSHDILHLLSPKTKSFICKNVQFSPNLTFIDIIKKAPNLNIIDLSQSNVEINALWPDILHQHSTKNNFKEISLRIPNFNFIINGLAEYMKKKINKSIIFHFCLSVKKLYEMTDKKLPDYLKDKFPSSETVFTISFNNGSLGFEYRDLVFRDY